MFCRKCGKTLLDGDRFCSYCGAQVIERSETMDIASNFEEVVYNREVKTKPYTDNNSQKVEEEATNFDVPKMNLTHKWQELQHKNEKGKDKVSGPSWNLEGFPLKNQEARRTEDIHVDWEKRQLLRFEEEEETKNTQGHGLNESKKETDDVKPESKAFESKTKTIENKIERKIGSDEVKKDIFAEFDRQEQSAKQPISRDTLIFQRDPIETEALEKEIFADMAMNKKSNSFAEEQIDKFYTFSQKNEEFQKLLDKEYDRIKKTTNGPLPEVKIPSNIEKLEINVPKDVIESPKNIEKLESKGLQVKETTEDVPSILVGINSDNKTGNEAVNKKTDDFQSNTMESNKNLGTASKSGFYNEHNVKSENKLENKLENKPDNKLENKLENKPENNSENKTDNKLEHKLENNSDNNARHHEPENLNIAKAVEIEMSTVDAFSGHQFDNGLEEEQDINSLSQSVDKKETEPLKDDDDLWINMERNVEAFTDDEKRKKIPFLAIALGIIITVLACEVVILGIKCFFPESNAATFINERLGVTVNWIDALKEKPQNNGGSEETDKNNENNQEAENQEEEAVETVNLQTPDPVPNPDKAYLVTEALAYNKNIQNVTADDTLTYKENYSYADKNINNSKPIENNIWYQDENGNTVYYDKEVVKTVIQFNSTWIDYVNNKDEAVLSLTKEGSPAYKSAKTFSKVGKVKENFDVLKIGEIRQTQKGFYVWVYEEISITENKSTKVSTHKWVYYLEPVEKQLKIVSFTEF
ncbi:MAG: zinc-ribbon domain-containing protein [Aminipila sp.]